MKLDKDTAKRVAIYVFHDREGIVDDYAPVFLRELKRFTEHLLVVVNGEINQSGLNKFENVADDVLVRENVGYDITGYRAGIQHLTWEYIDQFDECIFANSTLYGPLYPFDEMFEEMSGRDLDFWGITKHHKVPWDCFGTCKYGYIPEHIQSSFLVIRKSMGITPEYKKVWDELPEIHSYGEAIGFFEVIFTKESEEKGFKSGVYVDTSDLEGYTRYPLMMMADELIIRRKCPVMKQKSFSQNYYDILTDTVGNATVDTYDFLRERTEYDVNLIWDNILRINNMEEIKNIMHLNYILPKHHILNKNYVSTKKVALMMHIYYEDLIDYCFEYAKSMPDGSDIIITTPVEETKKALEARKHELQGHEVTVLLIENRGRDVSSLLVACAPYLDKYDYICYAHDKKTKQMEPYCNGLSFSYHCFENILGSKAFVENVIQTFDDNPRLGLLTPPPPSHGNFYQMVASEWAGDYEITLELLEKLGINGNIKPDRAPISPLGTMFWFKPEALKILVDCGWKYEDFPQEPNGTDGTILHAVERAYGIATQAAGYYPAWLMTDKFASIETTNFYFMLREINKKLLPNYNTSNLLDMVSNFERYITHQPEIEHLRGVIGELQMQASLRYQLKRKIKQFIPKWVLEMRQRLKK